ncbi:IQ calmodulin-binding motif protein [Aspergillus lucknowensis]|uniref:PLD phosphodiesterase domain-containing protein n=1 Tax=Aspergillus lucknowensis TaxID=176173 RepID=A0ABR4LPN7_9EURO
MPLVKPHHAALCIFLVISLMCLKRSSKSSKQKLPKMVSWKVSALCHGDRTVSSELADDPKRPPYKIFKELYEESHQGEHLEQDSDEKINEDDELKKAKECGSWAGAEPSKLFLRIYHDALCTLDSNPLGGVVSPPLMGSNGVVPLTIVAPLPDVCRHMANCIVRAEKEVFLATNYWIHSEASTLITEALRELSRRAGERGETVIVKVLYDRGDPRQVWDNHLSVDEKSYAAGKVHLPTSQEIPHVDMQVINYHRPIFGTFHAKFMVIDRRIGLIQSNNIQDNDNLEMMVHVEGPIVDSLYDTALISWGKALDPPLPMLNSPAVAVPPPSFSKEAVDVYSGEGDRVLPQHTIDNPHYDVDIKTETWRVNGVLDPREGESATQAVSRYLNHTLQPSTTGDAPDEDQENEMEPYVLDIPHEPFPMALVNREPYGSPDHTSAMVPQDATFLSAIRHAEHSIFIQTPNMNAEPLIEPLLNTVRRGVMVTCYLCLGYNDAGQLLPFQNGTNEMICNRLYGALKTDEERSRLRIYNYVGKDQTRPIHNKFKKRSCHIKLMVIDEKVAIQGNGNLDTQSFYHSQEVNLFLDSPLICRTWLDVINCNQNTAKYGLVSPEDGCWHDPEAGELPEGSLGIDPGRYSWVKGVVGAVQRVRGIGGF